MEQEAARSSERLRQPAAKEFKPQSDKAKESVEVAVRTLAEQALQAARSCPATYWTRSKGLIAALDKKLTDADQPDHAHAEFQKLEGAWRGLHYLVNNTETDEMLKIRVLNISKNDLARRSRSSRARPGTRVRSSRRCTKKSSASSAASPMAPSWPTTTSTTARPTSSC
jgi:predicted component of type VI protein secretion system